MPTITDSLFSLIIFIYVMITFLYLFYGFCWVEPPKLTEEQKKELAKQVNTLSYYQLAQHSHTVTLSHCHTVTLSHCHTVNTLSYQLAQHSHTEFLTVLKN